MLPGDHAAELACGTQIDGGNANHHVIRMADEMEILTKLLAFASLAETCPTVTWTEGGSFWEVGVPEVSNMQSVLDARADLDKGKADQRIGW